ncbi:MAG: hypothetical protein DCC68_25180, partial [Planctomycetota bacterium]
KKKEEKPKEIHICRGLNTCAGKGASGDNKCAGQGTCATTPNAPHECATGNACKGQGGCGATAGKNQCAGYGNGHVPLTEEDWPRLRREFENRMRRLKRQFGNAPPSTVEQESDARKAAADAKALAEAEAQRQAAQNGTPADTATAAKAGPNKTPPGRTPPKNTTPPKNNTATKDRPKPPRQAPPKDENTEDILGELTGDNDKGATPKKPAPKPAPK